MEARVDAKSCRDGAPLHKENHSVFFSIAALIAVCAAAVFSLPALAQQYRAWFVYPTLRAHINEKLRDPATTLFRNEFLTSLGHLCGELNSKNSMGGYVGFRRFVVAGPHDVLLEHHGSLSSDIHRTTEAMIAVLDKRNALLPRAIEAKVHVTVESVPATAEAAVFEGEWSRRCGK